MFDLEGRLIGIHLMAGFSDYHTFTGPEIMHLDIRIVQDHWRNLAAKKPLGEKATAGQSKTGVASSDETLPAVPSPDSPELAAVAAKIREATVAMVTFPQDPPFGCSGTIVTPDGYIATCGHHHKARGFDTTVYFADGRTAPAKILGRDDLLDIGLAKITARGPWPYIPLGKTADAKVGDPCIIAGYPNRLRKNGKVPLVVRGARIADMQYAPTELLSSCEVSDGDSGGGIFDAKGRLMGVLSGPAPPRKVCSHSGADGFALLWDRLLNGPALSDPVPFDASPAAAVVRKAIEGVPPIVCEVLGDGKRRALGTVVSPDGYVLTKASELYGDISCRLADGRVLPAVVRNVARQHDLALLKIDVAGLPNIIWSHSQESPVGTLVASPRIGELPAVGVVSYPTHKVGPAVGYLGIGKVKDGEGGVQVKELRGCWRPEFVKQVRNIPRAALPDYESPIRVGDIIVSIEGRAVPNAKTLEKILKTRDGERGREVPFVIAGDPIQVIVQREGKQLMLRFPLPSTHWDVRDKTSPRNCSFPAVFDTDASLARDLCGGPLVDCRGEVVGITIAVPISVVMQSPVMSRVFVVPAAVARTVSEELK